MSFFFLLCCPFILLLLRYYLNASLPWTSKTSSTEYDDSISATAPDSNSTHSSDHGMFTSTASVSSSNVTAPAHGGDSSGDNNGTKPPFGAIVAASRATEDMSWTL